MRGSGYAMLRIQTDVRGGLLRKPSLIGVLALASEMLQCERVILKP